MSARIGADGARFPPSRVWLYRIPASAPEVTREDLLVLTCAPAVDPGAIGLRHRVARAVRRSMRGASMMAQMLAVEMIDTLCFSMKAGDLVLAIDRRAQTFRPGRIEAGVRLWRGHLARPVRWHPEAVPLGAVPGMSGPPETVEICEATRRDLARTIGRAMDAIPPHSSVENWKNTFQRRA